MGDEELRIPQRIPEYLSESDLEITKGRSFLFDNIDSFVALSRENTCVKEVDLYPFDSDLGNYEVWDKVGQMVGNLTELQTIAIHFDSDRYGNWENCSPDWEILTRILRYLRRKVALCFLEDYEPENEEIQGLARAIHGHPMISDFSSEMGFTFASFGPWCSALATLSSLEKFTLGLREPETEDQHSLVNPEPLKELLRAPALRSVTFDAFSFTYALCHAVANALEEGSSVTDIDFEYGCSFPDGGRAIITNALKTNTTITNAQFCLDDCDEPSCNSLAAVLLCNSTLQYLNVHAVTRASGRCFSSVFLSLGMNTTLKSLSLSISDEFGDELCAAIRSGLAKNSTLEKLSLEVTIPGGEDGAVSARNALSFLRTNSTLKTLKVSFQNFVQAQMELYISAFRLEAVKMMENTFLESFTIPSSSGGGIIKVEELFALISALQLNTTLKTLGYQFFFMILYLTDDEVNQLVLLLMKNYGLERLVPDIACEDDRTIKAILRLNGAGRRYLIEDGSSISKGVEVLSAVNDDINCVFLHLLENPGLCNRRAIETTTTTRSRRPVINLDESCSTGKRERVQSQPGKEPRRRLA
jgi:hypothetical protein